MLCCDGWDDGDSILTYIITYQSWIWRTNLSESSAISSLSAEPDIAMLMRDWCHWIGCIWWIYDKNYVYLKITKGMMMINRLHLRSSMLRWLRCNRQGIRCKNIPNKTALGATIAPSVYGKCAYSCAAPPLTVQNICRGMLYTTLVHNWAFINIIYMLARVV